MFTNRISLPSRHAITLIELLAILLVLVIIVGILLPALPRHRTHPRYMRDMMALRQITQAMVVWADQNKDCYPLPSALDANNATLDQLASTKDTTGNILSILVMSGSIMPENIVSSAEVNARIQRFDSYQFASPSTAALPQNALWDPALRGTPDDLSPTGALAGAGIGHQSFAHALPFGKRAALWHDTYNSTEAIFANRGPTYAANDGAPASDKWMLPGNATGTGSNTLLIHGGRSTWEGVVAFNDNHVEFVATPTPGTLSLTLAFSPRGKSTTPGTAPDNLFVNETNESEGDGTTGRVDRGMNAYLRPIADVLERARPRVWRD